MKTFAMLALLTGFLLSANSVAQPPLPKFRVSVADYGALGDDEKPDDGAIKGAIDAVGGGGEVHFPPGVFHVIGQVVIKSGVQLIGHNATLKAGKPMGGVLLVEPGAANVGIVALRIEATGCEFALKATKASRLRVKDCEFLGPIERGHLIDFDGLVTDAEIESSSFADTMHGIRLRGPVERAKIEGCTFKNWLHHAVYLVADKSSGPQYPRVIGNRFQSPKSGKGGARQMIVAYPDPENLAVNMVGLQVLNNTCTGPSEHYDRNSETSRGTADQISIHYTSDFEISGNVSSGGGENGIVATNFCTRGIVSNNIASGNDGHGIQVSSLNERSSDILIAGNLCTNNGLRAGGRRDSIAGIYVQDAERIAIHANQIVDNRKTRKQWAGILIASSDDIALGRDNTIQFADTVGYHAAAVFESTLTKPFVIYHPMQRKPNEGPEHKPEELR